MPGKKSTEEMTIGELRRELNLIRQRLDASLKANFRKDLIIRNYEKHMTQINKKIDYLLNHPYSRNTSSRRRKK